MGGSVGMLIGLRTYQYEVLRDAFFRYQAKPRLTRFGELYFEGKEKIKSWKEFRPGVLSDRIREALGMGNKVHVPPPWLVNMQRYGLPPSYPGLFVAGVNFPVPSGCRFGFGPGEWGNPPGSVGGIVN